MRRLGPRGAVFLDRDGTINVGAPAGDYIVAPSQVKLLPTASEAIRRINQSGHPVIVVTNQRGISLGLMGNTDLDAIHEQLQALLIVCGAHIDAFYTCPHGLNECCCRKPKPGLLENAARDLDIDLSNSVMIGDSASDLRAGESAGVAVCVQLGVNAADLNTAVQMVM